MPDGGSFRALYDAGRASEYRSNPPETRPEQEELWTAQPRMLNEARHLAANSSTIKTIINSRCVNGIGPGLSYEPLIRDVDGNLLKDVNAQIRKLLRQWHKDPEVTGQYDAGALEELAWRSWDTDGEIMLREVIDVRFPLIPYRVQILETDYLPWGTIYDSRQTDGIDLDEYGAAVRYWFFKNLQDMRFRLGSRDLIPVPARMVHHLRHVVRPSQIRGVTLLHPIILRTVDVSDYEQSHRLASRAAEKAFAGINRSADWVLDTDPDSEGPSDPERIRFDNLEVVDNLNAGESITFFRPEHPNTAATEFLGEERRQIAAATRTSYSQTSLRYETSYGAQRLEMATIWRYTEADRARFISTLARPALYERPLEWIWTLGLIRLPANVDLSTIYDAEITGPVMPVIDPTKDTKAFKDQQDYGWDSRPGIIRKLGRRPDEVDSQRASDDMAPDKQV